MGLLFPFSPKVKYLAFLIKICKLVLSMEVFGQGGQREGAENLREYRDR